MRTIRRLRFSCLLFVSAFTLACSDGLVSPDPELQPSADLVSDAVQDEVNVVVRGRALAEGVSVTRTIGVLGGVISLPAAGLHVVVPFGALTKPTDITIVAPAGDLVGYHFFPDGTAFRAPLLVVQDLTGTSATLSGGNLLAAYIQGDVRPSVRPLERLPLDLTEDVGVFEISHFSGYVVATN